MSGYDRWCPKFQKQHTLPENAEAVSADISPCHFQITLASIARSLFTKLVYLLFLCHLRINIYINMSKIHLNWYKQPTHAKPTCSPFTYYMTHIYIDACNP